MIKYLILVLLISGCLVTKEEYSPVDVLTQCEINKNNIYMSGYVKGYQDALNKTNEYSLYVLN